MTRLELSALALLVVPVFAQLPDPVFHLGISLIRVDTEVVDSEGRPLSALTKEDFRAFDDGIEQPIVNFSFEEDPLDLILLFDLSGSMRKSVLGIVRAVELGFHELRKGDRVCVMAFHQSAFEVEPFTANLEAVNQAIAVKVLTLRFGGESGQEQAATDAALRFRREPKSFRRRAVLMITGRPETIPHGVETGVRELWQSDAVLSELVMGRAAHVQVLERGGSRIAEKTGGATILAGDPGQSFQQAIRLLRRRYTIYYASPAVEAGSQRSVTVRLSADTAKRFAGSHVRSRTGYVLDSHIQ